MLDELGKGGFVAIYKVRLKELECILMDKLYRIKYENEIVYYCNVCYSCISNKCSI